MFVALDLETTGLDSNSDEIIEIAILKIDSETFEIKDTFNTLINPGIEIPTIISNITGITSDDIVLSPYFDEIKAKIEDFIGDLPILGHNISFDISFLEKKSLNLKNNILIDTFLLSNFLDYNEKSLSLESLAQTYKIEFKGAHRALNDILVNVLLFEKQIKKIQKLKKQKKEILKYVFSKTADKGFAYILDKYIDSDTSLIDSSILIKYILKNFVEYKKKSNIFVDNELKIDNSKEILSSLEGIDLRENQEIMLDNIDSILDNNELKLIEAPTGLGKTFAYLTPSIIYSIKTGEQVFVSTTTKALQDQIFYKDLKFLKENMDFDFSYSKLKGKRNYFSLFTFFRFLGEIDFFSVEQASFVLKIVYWLEETKSFELDELDYYGDEFSFIREINADDFIVFSKKNIYEKREPSIIARKNAKDSNIVIVNNSILFQDIAGDNSILGNIKNLVLDEAHNLEDVVTNSLKKGFSIKELEKTFNNVNIILKKYKYEVSNFYKNSEKLLFNLQLIFDSLEVYLQTRVSFDSNYKNVLIGEDFYENNIDNFDINNIENIIKTDFLSIIDSLKLVPDDVYIELSKDIGHIEIILDIVDKILNKTSQDKYIKTINFSNYKGLYVEYSLLNIGDFLQKKLWNKLDSCVLTSATLSINNSFDYIKNILSLDDFDFIKLKSDFDYKKQALLYLPNDLGNIKNNIDNIIKFIKEFILIVKGQTLVLFTALYLIKKVYSNIAGDLKKQNINIYAQSIGGGKNKIIGFYKQNYKNSVILGTDTFWEGIDLKGDELKYLIIHKVPFMVPTDPIFQARSRLFKDSFREYSIPKAIIKLKQGFGRLIRTKSDSGIIVFLDDRIINTSWGNTLLEAFPKEINVKKGSHLDLLKVLENNIQNKK